MVKDELHYTNGHDGKHYDQSKSDEYLKKCSNMSKIKSRECIKCKTVLPVTPENFYRDKYRLDGFMLKCKKCMKKEYQEKKSKKKSKTKKGRVKDGDSKKDWKSCITCGFREHGHHKEFPKDSPCLSCEKHNNWKKRKDGEKSVGLGETPYKSSIELANQTNLVRHSDSIPLKCDEESIYEWVKSLPKEKRALLDPMKISTKIKEELFGKEEK